MNELLLLIHGVMNVFVEGTSPVRPLLYTVYLFLFLCGFFFLQRKKIHSTVTTTVSRVAFGSLLILCVATLFLQISVFNQLSIPQTTGGYFFTQSEFTFSHVMHSHFGKLALAPFIEPFATSLMKSADTGIALLAFVPGWIPYGMALLLLLFVFSSIYIGVVRSLPFSSRYKKGISIFFYSFLSFVVISKIIDGGIVSLFGWSFLFLYALILFVPVRYFLRGCCFISILAGFHVSTIALLGIGQYSFFSAFINMLQIAAIGIFFLALHSSLYGTKKKSEAILGIVLSFLAIVAFSLYQGQKEWKYFISPLPTPHGYMIASYETLPDSAPVASFNSLHLYVPNEFPAAITTRAIIEKFELPGWYHPVAPLIVSCSTQATVGDSFILVSTHVLEKTQSTHPFASITLSLLKTDGSRFWYEGNTSLAACIPSHFRTNVLHELLKETQGENSSFVIYRKG